MTEGLGVFPQGEAGFCAGSTQGTKLQAFLSEFQLRK